ncbi:MAG TPA: nitroreductase family protein [Candidatus Cloacimonadota bacterium]|nr:nitroreductase family protein [Candidatus Cloacimonadota bacterium]
MLKDLIERNRSYRRFDQTAIIGMDTLSELINLARMTANGANIQSLRFKLLNTPENNEKVFSCLKWAGYLPEWSGPQEGEKPTAYIIVLNETKLKNNAQYDVGLACQSILLGAVEKGLGGCLFGSVDRNKLSNIFALNEHYEITLVIALGKPVETVVLEDADDDIRYWRDENQVHHVPKRKLADLIV